MSELADARVVQAGAIDPLLLKRLSTIVLVMIATILTWVQGGGEFARTILAVGLSLVAVSTVLCFVAMSHSSTQRKSGTKLRWLLRWERGVASGVFTAGFGIFMREKGNSIQ